VSGLEKGLDALFRNISPPIQPCNRKQGFERFQSRRWLCIARHNLGQ
jgi:hypothetical protein